MQLWKQGEVIMVDWLAGKRMRGTSTERTGSYMPEVGGWVELARTTLSSAGDNITVSSLSDKRYYMVLQDFIPDTYAAPRMRLGNGSADTGSNYSDRRNENGGTDATRTSQTSMINTPEGGGNPQFIVSYIANLSGKEKLCMHHSVHRKNAGAANAAGRGEAVSKWGNTSNPLDVVDIFNNDAGAGDFASGSEVVVLGYDPDDTHTTNFWEELTTKTSTSEANTLTTDTVTAKKYNWVQVHIPYTTGSANNYNFRVGNSTIDTGSNYCQRYSIDGGADGTQTSQGYVRMSWNISTGSEWMFANIFFINNASNEKLFISHANRNNTSGAGTAPHRYEVVGKWANTSNQANVFQILHQTGASNLGTGSIIKWWGAD